MIDNSEVHALPSNRVTQLNEAALDVLARDNLTRDGLSALAPIAHLALAPFFLPDRSLAAPDLGDYLEEAGLPQSRATRLMRSLARPGPHQAQFAERLARAGADPARLREMSVAESSEYLVPLLAKL